MRVLHISDFHLRGDGRPSFRVVDTAACLETTVRHLKGLRQRPDCMVVTGDLADSGDERAYLRLADALGSLGWPVYAVPGNHDRRDRMRALLPGWCPADPEVAPYICFAVEREETRLLFLDTMAPGSHSGHAHAPCVDWLVRRLAERPGVPALVFMHHPPFVTGLGAMDEPYANVESLVRVVRSAPWVRLCCGHMHRPIFTVWEGAAALTVPSASMQLDLDLSPEGGDTFVMEAPGYALHDFRDGGWNSHICQIYGKPGYDGPYPFLDSVNPVEE